MKYVVHFLRKHFELWPLTVLVGAAFAHQIGYVIYGCWQKDFILKRGRYPWDTQDLLVHPRSRKIFQIHENFDELKDMECAYREMDRRQRDRDRQRQRADKCAS